MALEMTSTLLQNAPFHRIFPPIKGHFIDTYVRAREHWDIRVIGDDGNLTRLLLARYTRLPIPKITSTSFRSPICKLLFTKKHVTCCLNPALIFIKQEKEKPEREH